MLSNRHFIRHALCFSAVILSLFASFAYGEGPVPIPPPAENSSDVLIKAVGDAIQRVKPSLVRILVVAVKYEDGREVKYRTLGSGVIITGDGYVITNHHVAGHARRIVCTLSDKEEIAADLIGTDPLADIAVIKLRNDNKRKFPAVIFGDSSLLRVGDRVLAMGSPYALSQSVTMGIVSNAEVVMPEFSADSRFILEGEDVGSVVRWIGHDAQIFGGNSGGPLVNLKGEIVGINEINIGISGAIPGNLAKEVADKIIKSGKVSRSWFGLDIQPLLKHTDQKKGALVSGVMKESPAEKAGFLPGDVLISIAGKEVTARFPEEVPILNQTMMDIPVGETVEAVVRRGDKDLHLSVVPQEREYSMPRSIELSQWGMTARNLSYIDSKEMKRESRDGVLVTSVRPGGSCREAEPKVAAGDVIVRVNNTDVKNVEDLIKLTREMTKHKVTPVPVLATFDRNKERYLTVINLKKKKEASAEEEGIDACKPWLPIATQVVTKDIAASLGDPKIRGMRITRVYSDIGEKTGLLTGDIITAVNDDALSPSSSEDGEVLDEMLHQYCIGSKVKLKVLRGGENLTVETVLGQSPKSAKDMKRYTDNNFEFTVRDLSFLDNARENSSGGVLVEAVIDGGWASLARLSIGDLILSVDGRPVTDTASFEKEMKRVSAGKPKSTSFQILRGIHTQFVEMEPAWPDVE